MIYFSFQRHPEPFYDIARQLIDREYKPTKAHCFIKLLSDKGLLLRNYSQNVDGLEIQAGMFLFELKGRGSMIILHWPLIRYSSLFF